MLRTKAALVAGAAALAGVGVMTTTTPATAATTCNSSMDWVLGSAVHLRLPKTGDTTLCFMNPGAHGNHVFALQNALERCYGRNIALDSDYGPKTKDALKYAQEEAGITADGLYGPETRRSILWPGLRDNGTFNGKCYDL